MPYPQVTDRVKEAPAVVLRAVFAGIGQLLLVADKIRARVMEQMQAHEEQPGPTAAPPAAEQPPQRSFDETGNVRVLRAPGQPGATEGAEGEGEARPAEPVPAEPAAAGPAPAEPTPAEPAAAEPAAAEPVPAEPAPEAAPSPPPGTSARRPRPTAKPAAAKPGAARAGTGPARTTRAKPRPAAQPRAGARPGPAAQSQPGQPAAGRADGTAPLPGYDDMSVASLRARLRVLDAAAVRAMLDYERAHARRETVITMFERRLAKLGGAAG